MLPEEINEKTTVAELAGEIVEHPNLWGMHSIEDAINKIISFRTPPPPQGNTPASERGDEAVGFSEFCAKGYQWGYDGTWRTNADFNAGIFSTRYTTEHLYVIYKSKI